MGVYNAGAQPAGFSLANIDLAGQQGEDQAAIGRERVLRNYSQFDLPDLLGAQAARGAFSSSATDNKRTRLGTAAGDSLTDISLGLASQQANLAANALLAQTGIRLGGS